MCAREQVHCCAEARWRSSCGWGDGEAQRYGNSVSPVVFEASGRMGRGGIAAITAMDRDARMYGKRRLGKSPGLNLRSLRVLLEAAVIRHDADAALLSLGSLGTVALGWVPGWAHNRLRQ